MNNIKFLEDTSGNLYIPYVDTAGVLTHIGLDGTPFTGDPLTLTPSCCTSGGGTGTTDYISAVALNSTVGASGIQFTGVGSAYTGLFPFSSINLSETNNDANYITLADIPAATITTQDEGTTLSAATTTINFVGDNVTATQSGGVTTVAISGGGGGTTNTFSNGITETSGAVKLGGSLTETTVITVDNFQLNATGANTLLGINDTSVTMVSGDAQVNVSTLGLGSAVNIITGQTDIEGMILVAQNNGGRLMYEKRVEPISINEFLSDEPTTVTTEGRVFFIVPPSMDGYIVTSVSGMTYNGTGSVNFSLLKNGVAMHTMTVGPSTTETGNYGVLATGDKIEVIVNSTTGDDGLTVTFE